MGSNRQFAHRESNNHSLTVSMITVRVEVEVSPRTTPCERRSGSAQSWRSEIFRHDICRRIGRTLPSASWWQSAAGWQALSTP